MNSQNTSAKYAKERQYAQLAASLTRLSHTVGQTADLFEHLQVDLAAMRTLAGLHAAQFMATATLIGNENVDDSETSSTLGAPAEEGSARERQSRK